MCCSRAVGISQGSNLYQKKAGKGEKWSFLYLLFIWNPPIGSPSCYTNGITRTKYNALDVIEEALGYIKWTSSLWVCPTEKSTLRVLFGTQCDTSCNTKYPLLAFLFSVTWITCNAELPLPFLPSTIDFFFICYWFFLRRVTFMISEITARGINLISFSCPAVACGFFLYQPKNSLGLIICTFEVVGLLDDPYPFML